MVVSMGKVKAMNEYEFTLTFDLHDDQGDPEQYADALFEAGCDDALVGIGLPGTIALEFVREAVSASDAMKSAIENVKHAIPEAELIEAKPDLVGLSDVAEILDCSRQNIRKYMNKYAEFPHPMFTGRTQLWHLWEVARFEKLNVPANVFDISKAAFRVNLGIQQKKL